MSTAEHDCTRRRQQGTSMRVMINCYGKLSRPCAANDRAPSGNDTGGANIDPASLHP